MEALNIPDEDLTAKLIRYGLYFGAVFQIVCLGAVIFLPNEISTANSGTIWNFLKVNNNADLIKRKRLTDFVLRLIFISE